MDEIWGNIYSTTNLVSQKGTMDFQEILTPRNQHQQRIPSCPCSSRSKDTANKVNLPSPATVLSLNSPQDFQFPATPVFAGSNQPNPLIGSPFNAGLDGLVTSSGFSDFIEKNRASLGNCGGGGGGEKLTGDRRFKRMMMNRASAARSRARKQAYTYELEGEIAQIKEENAKLKKQIEKLLVDAQAARDQLPK